MLRSLGLTFVLCAVSLSAQDLPIGRMTKLAGMQAPGMVIREANGIPHVFALNTHDAVVVNGYLQAHPGQLSPEYSLLGIQSIPAWTPVDSVAIGKLLALQLSFDLDLDATVALISDQTAGKMVGFDGTKLFTDTWRLAPFT